MATYRLLELLQFKEHAVSSIIVNCNLFSPSGYCTAQTRRRHQGAGRYGGTSSEAVGSDIDWRTMDLLEANLASFYLGLSGNPSPVANRCEPFAPYRVMHLGRRQKLSVRRNGSDMFAKSA
jgi:hypothetical protein